MNEKICPICNRCPLCQRGEGPIQNVVSKVFFGGRKGGEKTVETLMAVYGSRIITELTVFRIPLSPALSKAGDLLSLGSLKKKSMEMGYDKLFHIWLSIRFSDGSHIGLEKNEVITVKPNYLGEPLKQDYMTVPHVAEKHLNLRGFILRTEQQMGKDAFYEYSAFNHNCQDFILNLLSANGLLTPELKAFLFQDVAELKKGVPGFLPHLANTATDLAGTWKLIRGRGY